MCALLQANDFDVLITEDIWDDFAKTYQIKMGGKVPNINIGNIQLMSKGSMYLKPEIASLDEMINTANLIQGHRFLKLELVRKFKLNEGREKDLKDVELIDAYLQNKGV